MKSLFSEVSPNRESSATAGEEIRKEREIVTTPASGNVFSNERFDGPRCVRRCQWTVAVLPYHGPDAPTLHATSSPPAVLIAVSAPRSIACMRQILSGRSCAGAISHGPPRHGPAIASYNESLRLATNLDRLLQLKQTPSVSIHSAVCRRRWSPLLPPRPATSVAAHSSPVLLTKDVLDADEGSFTGSSEAGRCRPVLSVNVAALVPKLALT